MDGWGYSEDNNGHDKNNFKVILQYRMCEILIIRRQRPRLYIEKLSAALKLACEL